MKSSSESLSHPEADLRSQTRVNPFRFTTTASLRTIGKACRMSGNRFLLHLSFTGEKRIESQDESQGTPQGGVISPLLVNSYFDFLGYRFQRSKQGKMMRFVRPKNLRKMRESIKSRTSRNHGKSMEAIVADLNQTLPGWFGYFKNVKASQLGEIDGWIRMRLRSILRKRRGLEGRGRGKDHQHWPNRYFEKFGLFCPLDARETEYASLRHGANH